MMLNKTFEEDGPQYIFGRYDLNELKYIAILISNIYREWREITKGERIPLTC